MSLNRMPSSKTRVLIVDDALIFRQLMVKVIDADPTMEVAATAADADSALEQLRKHRVDVVSIDVDIPELDAAVFLRRVRRIQPNVPVLILSAFRRPGACEIQSQTRGTNECVTKAPHSGSALSATEWLQEHVLPRLKRLATPATPPIARPAAVAAPVLVPPRALGMPRGAARARRVDIIVIGASTGGPTALEAVMSKLGGPLLVPIVIVQHMPAEFTRLLAQRLTTASQLTVVEGVTGTPVTPGGAWLARGGEHLIVERNGRTVVLRTTQQPPENSCRPAVDPLFRSVSQVYGANVLAVVLTGMGHDGLAGAQMIHDAGGQIVVQDEATSTIWGMPGAIARAGLADKVLPLDQLADEILQRVNEGRVRLVRAKG